MPANKLSTDNERFDKNVNRTSTGCWLWTGNIANNGYGQIGIGSRAKGTFKMANTHRFALERALGRPLQNGMQALHTCDNKACVRNDKEGFYYVNGLKRHRRGHLWEGTTQDNTADRYAKKRSASGNKNGSRVHPERLERGQMRYNAKLTDDKVREIRKRYTEGTASMRQLSAEYGIFPTNVHKVIHRLAWKHVV